MSDDDEKKGKRNWEGIATTILIVLGLGGAVLSAVAEAYARWKENEDKKDNEPDETAE